MTSSAPSCRHTGPSWWSDRWAWRGALAAGPIGALLAILHALVAQRTGVEQALVAYVVGALAAAGLGCLLGGALGAVGTGLRHRHCSLGEHAAPAPDRELSAA